MTSKKEKISKIQFLDKLEEMFSALPSYLQPKILNAVAFLYQSRNEKDNKMAFARRVEVLRECKNSNFTAEEMAHIILLSNMDMVHDMMWTHPQTDEIKELVEDRKKNKLH
tara:strand:- start:212 stop:544 length:333 start_codon:yes stop_codon:yes gene_type:complete